MLIKKLHQFGLRSEYAYAAAVASIGLSIAAWYVSNTTERAGIDRADRWGIFVGTWAPTLFGLGNALHQYEQEEAYAALAAGSPAVAPVTP